MSWSGGGAHPARDRPRSRSRSRSPYAVREYRGDLGWGRVGGGGYPPPAPDRWNPLARAIGRDKSAPPPPWLLGESRGLIDGDGSSYGGGGYVSTSSIRDERTSAVDHAHQRSRSPRYRSRSRDRGDFRQRQRGAHRSASPGGSGGGSGSRLSLDEMLLQERAVRVGPPRLPLADNAGSPRLFVANIPFEADESSLQTYFESRGHRVTDVWLSRLKGGKGAPRGFGYVTLASTVNADVLLSQHHSLYGRPLYVTRSADESTVQPPPPRLPATGGDPLSLDDSKRLFVANIPFEADESLLQTYFESRGHRVTEVWLSRAVGGKSRGWGYVLLASVQDVAVVLVQKHVLNGRLLDVKPPCRESDGGEVTRESSPLSGGDFRWGGETLVQGRARMNAGPPQVVPFAPPLAPSPSVALVAGGGNTLGYDDDVPMGDTTPVLDVPPAVRVDGPLPLPTPGDGEGESQTGGWVYLEGAPPEPVVPPPPAATPASNLLEAGARESVALCVALPVEDPLLLQLSQLNESRESITSTGLLFSRDSAVAQVSAWSKAVVAAGQVPQPLSSSCIALLFVSDHVLKIFHGKSGAFVRTFAEVLPTAVTVMGAREPGRLDVMEKVCVGRVLALLLLVPWHATPVHSPPPLPYPLGAQPLGGQAHLQVLLCRPLAHRCAGSGW